MTAEEIQVALNREMYQPGGDIRAKVLGWLGKTYPDLKNTGRLEELFQSAAMNAFDRNLVPGSTAKTIKDAKDGSY